jgi:DNA-binding response OmpR family regulator
LPTVLMIEDDPTLLDNTLEILSLEGFDVIGAEDGSVGVDKARRYVPDIIICDIMMPKLDGYGVLKALRTDPTTSEIPFIFVSAAVDEKVLGVSTKLGVDAYLVKPFRTANLINLIRAQLENQVSRSD